MQKLSLNKNKIKILLLEGIHEKAVQEFKDAGYTNIEYYKTALEKNELIRKIKDTHILGIRSRTQVDADILKEAKKLITIGCFCIGVNQVDLDMAKKIGIPVFNAPYSNTRSVAELVIGEVIMLMRGISEKNVLMHQGVWKKTAANAYEIREKNIGIVGYGHIGSQVSVLAESLGMSVHYYDIENKLSIGNAKACKSLNELLKISDVVTLHVPSTPETKNIISKNELYKMRKGSYIINLSRGDTVNIPDLAKSLKEKHIAGAAIDVFPKEPATGDEEFKSELREFNNVILTAHIGGSTKEAQKNIGQEVAEKLIKYSDNGSTLGAQNFVQVSILGNLSRKRFFHMHKNKPGVIDKINKLFASYKLNILSQYLQTDCDIGYVIIDTKGKIDPSFLKKLNSIPHTIRCRMLY